MTKFIKLSTRAAILLACLMTSMTLFALDLREAKEQGLVGETSSGYLEGRISDAGVVQLVEEINAQRKAEYLRIASKNNISIADVEVLAGKKAIEKTPARQFIKTDGLWRQK